MKKPTHYIDIETPKGKKVRMTIDTYARWICLLEALDVITNMAERKHIDLNNNKWVKPLALQKYITERFPSMLHDLTVEEGLLPG